MEGPTRRDGTYKLREELGTSVSDPGVSLRDAGQLGYEVSIAIDRVIVQYDLAGTMVRFEHYPRMDDLVEVEGAPEQIERAIAVLGLARDGFTTDRLPDFVRRYEERTGGRAAISDADLAETDRSTSPMPDASLPELARSLRSLGAARDPATEAAHDAIFAPADRGAGSRRARRRARRGALVPRRHAARGDRARGERRGHRRHGESSRRPCPVGRRADAIEPLRAALRSLDEEQPPRRRGRAVAGVGADRGAPADVRRCRRDLRPPGAGARRARARNGTVTGSVVGAEFRANSSVATRRKSRYISSAMRIPTRLGRFPARRLPRGHTRVGAGASGASRREHRQRRRRGVREGGRQPGSAREHAGVPGGERLPGRCQAGGGPAVGIERRPRGRSWIRSAGRGGQAAARAVDSLASRFASTLGNEAKLELPKGALDLAEGKAIYERSCASCHGATGPEATARRGGG